MDTDGVIRLLILLLLVFLSGVFSSMETALVTMNQMRLRTLVDEGNRRAIILSKVLDRRSKMLSAILISNNVVNLSASSLATTLAMDLWGNAFVSLATGVLTIVVLIFGEITPKNVASQYAEKMALFYAPITMAMMTVLTPVIFVINLFGNGVLRLLGVDPDSKPEAITESELRTIVNVSQEEGVIEKEEQIMINNVVDFGDSLTRDVMVPRIDVIALPADVTYQELTDTFRENMFTRMPIYDESTDNIIGIVNVKDLLFIKSPETFNVRDYMREAYFTYEFKRTSELFIEMRQNYVSLAIVLDEYGATAGLVTLEDLLEEIVGEIRDEYDEDELNNVQKLNERTYRIDGATKLDDLNDLLELSLESEDYDSLGGLIIGQLDHLPDEGEAVMYEDIRLTVETLDKNRIEWVRMELPEKKEDEDSEEQ
ncbi:MAG: HlyC/CorC family transporter [Lachnospiraceae bacterium]|nr:HlyC/CorC family transporter [Lachnospiraceae bacterium]